METPKQDRLESSDPTDQTNSSSSESDKSPDAIEREAEHESEAQHESEAASVQHEDLTFFDSQEIPTKSLRITAQGQSKIRGLVQQVTNTTVPCSDPDTEEEQRLLGDSYDSTSTDTRADRSTEDKLLEEIQNSSDDSITVTSVTHSAHDKAPEGKTRDDSVIEVIDSEEGRVTEDQELSSYLLSRPASGSGSTQQDRAAASPSPGSQTHAPTDAPGTDGPEGKLTKMSTTAVEERLSEPEVISSEDYPPSTPTSEEAQAEMKPLAPPEQSSIECLGDNTLLDASKDVEKTMSKTQGENVITETETKGEDEKKILPSSGYNKSEKTEESDAINEPKSETEKEELGAAIKDIVGKAEGDTKDATTEKQETESNTEIEKTDSITKAENMSKIEAEKVELETGTEANESKTEASQIQKILMEPEVIAIEDVDSPDVPHDVSDVIPHAVVSASRKLVEGNAPSHTKSSGITENEQIRTRDNVAMPYSNNTKEKSNLVRKDRTEDSRSDTAESTEEGALIIDEPSVTGSRDTNEEDSASSVKTSNEEPACQRGSEERPLMEQDANLDITEITDSPEKENVLESVLINKKRDIIANTQTPDITSNEGGGDTLLSPEKQTSQETTATSTPSTSDVVIIETAQAPAIAKTADTDVVIEMAHRAAVRQESESQYTQAYTKYDMVLLRILDSANFKTEPSARQFEMDDGDDGAMLTSLRKILQLPSLLYRCPYSSEPGPTGECLYKKYNYSNLVHHLMSTHHFNVSCKQTSVTDPAHSPTPSIKHTDSAYMCTTCPFTSQHVVIFLEHLRHHVLRAPPYRCISCGVDVMSHDCLDHFKRCKALELNISLDHAAIVLRYRYIATTTRTGHAFFSLATYLQHIGKPMALKAAMEAVGRPNYFRFDSESGRYWCKECGCQTPWGDAFVEHLRCHLTAVPYGCSRCERRFKTIDDFIKHRPISDGWGQCKLAEIVAERSCQPQIEATLATVHSFHRRSAAVTTAKAVTSPPKPDTSPPKTAATQEDDLITYYDCVTHSFQTANYILYLKHLLNFHVDFTKVAPMASRGDNQTIAFKDGHYICTGCDLRTTLRVVFKEHMRCHTLTHPYRCVLCNKELKTLDSVHLPCQTLSSIVVRPSPAMEALMGKLGPQAPPTSQAEEVGLFHPVPGDMLRTMVLQQERPSSADVSRVRQSRDMTSPRGSRSHSASPLKSRSNDGANSDSTPALRREATSATVVRNPEHLDNDDDVLIVDPPEAEAAGSNPAQSGSEVTRAFVTSTNDSGGMLRQLRPNISIPERGKTVPGDSDQTSEISRQHATEIEPSRPAQLNYDVTHKELICKLCNFQTSDVNKFRFHIYTDIHVLCLPAGRTCSQCDILTDRLKCPLVTDLLNKLLAKQARYSEGREEALRKLGTMQGAHQSPNTKQLPPANIQAPQMQSQIQAPQTAIQTPQVPHIQAPQTAIQAPQTAIQAPQTAIQASQVPQIQAAQRNIQAVQLPARIEAPLQQTQVGADSGSIRLLPRPSSSTTTPVATFRLIPLGPAPSSAPTTPTFQPGVQATIQTPNQPYHSTTQPALHATIAIANQSASQAAVAMAPQTIHLTPVVTSDVSLIPVASLLPGQSGGTRGGGHVSQQEVIAKVLTAIAQTSALAAQGQAPPTSTKQTVLVPVSTPTKQSGLVQKLTPAKQQGLVPTPDTQSLHKIAALPQSPAIQQSVLTIGDHLQGTTQPQGVVPNPLLSQRTDGGVNEQRPDLPLNYSKSSIVENPFAIEHLKKSFHAAQHLPDSNTKQPGLHILDEDITPLTLKKQSQSSAKTQASNKPAHAHVVSQASGDVCVIEPGDVTMAIQGGSTPEDVPFITSITPVTRASDEVLEIHPITNLSTSQKEVQVPKTSINEPELTTQIPGIQISGIQVPQPEIQAPQAEIQAPGSKQAAAAQCSAVSVEDELEPGEVRDEDSNEANQEKKKGDANKELQEREASISNIGFRLPLSTILTKQGGAHSKQGTNDTPKASANTTTSPSRCTDNKHTSQTNFTQHSEQNTTGEKEDNTNTIKQWKETQAADQTTNKPEGSNIPDQLSTLEKAELRAQELKPTSRRATVISVQKDNLSSNTDASAAGPERSDEIRVEERQEEHKARQKEITKVEKKEEKKEETLDGQMEEEEEGDDGVIVKTRSVLKCDIKNGRYTCYNCDFSTYNGKAFKVHLIKHTHERNNVCSHLPPGSRNKVHKCPIILGLVQLLIQKAQGKPLQQQEVQLYEEKFPAYYEDIEKPAEEEPVGGAEESDGVSSLVITDVYGGVHDMVSSEDVSTETIKNPPATATEPEEMTSAGAPVTSAVYECAVGGCAFCTDAQEEFVRHCHTHHNDLRVLPCKCCKRAGFVDAFDLAVHLYNMCEDRRQHYTCQTCTFHTANLQTFERHVHKRHADDVTHTCGFCDATFDDIALFFDHLSRAIVKVIACPYCSKEVSDKRWLMTHIATSHPGEPRRIQVSKRATCREEKLRKEQPGKTDVRPHTPAKKPSTQKSGKVTPLTSPRSAASRQSSESESASNRLDCPRCDFQAWSKAMLDSHVMWHDDVTGSRDTAAHFRCPVCPCAVSRFTDFRFHLQFHKQETKVKYYECASCTYRSNSEEAMETHHHAAHVSPGNPDSSDEEATYMVKKLKVAFHAGRYTCPKDACAESFEQIVALQEHCVQQHGHPLADRHRLDFYCDATSGGDSSSHGDDRSAAVRSADIADHEFAIDLPPITQVKTEPGEELISVVTRHHCDTCHFNTNDFIELQNHMKTAHAAKLSTHFYREGLDDLASEASEETDFGVSSREDVMSPSKSDMTSASTGSGYKCPVCTYSTMYRKSHDEHMKLHKKFENNYTGIAYKCGYCRYMSIAKTPISTHIKSFHSDKAHKMLLLKLENSRIISEQDISGNAKKGKAKGLLNESREKETTAEPAYSVSSSSRSLHHADKQHDTLPRGDSRVAMTTPEEDDMDIDSEDEALWNWAGSAEQQVAGGGGIPVHRDPDSNSAMTRNDEAFCNKVSGLKLYQCKLCAFMAESCSRVRTHYLREHPRDLPLLCGYCRERCDEQTFRAHHRTQHASLPLQMIRLAHGDVTDSKHLDLSPGETEIEEIIDCHGSNDWTVAILPLVAKEADGTYRCVICGYRKTLALLNRHLLPVHFHQKPLVCLYCNFGAPQMNMLRNHMEKLHPGQPTRIRKPLPVMPTPEQVLKVTEAVTGKATPSPRSTHSSILGSQSPLNPAPTMTSRSHVVPSPARSARSESSSPARSRSLQSPISQDSSFLDPNTVTQEQPEVDPNLAEEGAARGRKTYKCLYCSHSSKWTCSDVQRHVLTTHLGYKLFNCVYCEFGHNSRSRLESHCAEAHRGKPARSSALDKRMAAIRVLRQQPEGVDVLALYSPSGEPVLTLDPSQLSVLRRYTLRTASQAKAAEKLTVKAEETSLPAKQNESPPKLTSRRGGKRGFAAERGKAMATVGYDSTKTAYVCTLCDLVLDKIERVRYHVICHHWNLRPYKCPVCDTYKYQREQVRVHMEHAHPGSGLRPANLCDIRQKELTDVIHRIPPDTKAKVQTSESSPRRRRKSSSCAVSEDSCHEQEEEQLPQEELWRCLEPGCGIVAPYQAVQNHVLIKHIKTQVYLCDFCTEARNDIEQILEHLESQHPSYPQRFSHSYGHHQEKVDSLISRYTPPVPQSPTEGSTVTPPAGPATPPAGPSSRHATPPTGPSSRHATSADKPKTKAGRQKKAREPDVPKVSKDEPGKKCRFCEYHTPSMALMDHHFETKHLEHVLFECSLCGGMHSSREDLVTHYGVLHRHDTLQYKVVPTTTDEDEQEEGMQRPSKLVIPQPAVRERGFSSPPPRVRTDSMHECDFCAFASADPRDLQRHLHLLHGVSPGNTEGASEDKKIQPMQTDAVFQAAAEYSYACAHCSYTSRERASIRRHVMTHVNYQPYRCPHCDVSAANRGQIRSHLSTAHKGKTDEPLLVRNLQKEREVQESIRKILPTQPAEQPTTSTHTLKRKHSADSDSQTRTLPNKAEVAKVVKVKGRARKRTVGLTRKMFVCRICRYHNRIRNHVARHIMTHLHYHKYKCPYCSFTAVQTIQVTSHVSRTHSRMRKYYITMTQPDMEKQVLHNLIKTDDPYSVSPGRQATSVIAPKRAKPLPSDKATPQHAVTSSRAAVTSRTIQTVLSKLKCRMCGYVVRGKVHMKRHLRIHFDYRKFGCPYCAFSSVHNAEVTQHVTHDHVGSDVRYVTNLQPSLEVKVDENLIVLEKKKRVTSEPNTAADQKLKIIKTIKKKTKGKVGISRKRSLDESPETKVKVGSPKKQASGEHKARYGCRMCLYKTIHRQRIRNHVRTHINYRKFGCPLCGHRTVTRSNMALHFKGRHPDQTFDVLIKPCADAERRTEENTVILSANESCSSSPPRRLSPPKTPSLKHSKSRSSPPKSVASPRKQLTKFQCRICKTYTSAQLEPMRVHIRTHLEYSKYGCGYCDYKRSSKGAIVKHQQRAHAQEPAQVVTFKHDDLEAKVRDSIHRTSEYNIQISKAKIQQKLASRNSEGKSPVRPSTPKSPKVRSPVSKVKSPVKVTAPDTKTTVSKSPKVKSPKSKGSKVKLTGRKSTKAEKREDNKKETCADVSDTGDNSANKGGGHFQCLQCQHTNTDHEAMRRHVSYHLLYRRYACAYCDVTSVAPTNISTHMRAEHPNLEARVVEKTEPDMEQKVSELMRELDKSEIEMKITEKSGAEKKTDSKPAIKLKLKTSKAAVKDAEQIATESADAPKQDDASGPSSKEPLQTTAKQRRKSPKKQTGEVKPSSPTGKKSKKAKTKTTEDIAKPSGKLTSDTQGKATTGAKPKGKPRGRKQKSPSPAKQQVAGRPKSPQKLSPGSGVLGEVVCFRCVRCPYETQHRGSMHNHIMWKIGYKPFGCGYCSFKDVLSSGLKKHIARKHKGRSVEQVLRKEPKKEAEVTSLMEQSTVREPPKRTTSSEGTLSAPELDDDRPSKKMRLEPETSTSKSSEGLEHTSMTFSRRDPVSGQYTCTECEYTCTEAAMMKTHARSHETPRWRCDLCSKTFSGLSALTKHCTTIHKRSLCYTNLATGEKCVNNKVTNQASNPSKSTKLKLTLPRPLSPHISSPRSNSPASRSFSPRPSTSLPGSPRSVSRSSAWSGEESDRLSVASGTSLAERLMCCGKCPFTTRAEINLLAHLQCHTESRGNRVFRCHFCSLVTFELDEFRAHARKHVRSKPYTCAHCGQAFTLRKYVLQHCTVKHPDLPVKIALAEAGKKSQLRRIHLQPRVPLRDVKRMTSQQLYGVMLQHQLQTTHL